MTYSEFSFLLLSGVLFPHLHLLYLNALPAFRDDPVLSA